RPHFDMTGPRRETLALSCTRNPSADNRGSDSGPSGRRVPPIARSSPPTPANQGQTMLRKLWRMLIGLAALIALTGAGAPPSNGLDIYFIDVDGGAATLLVTPEKESILIDCGWPGKEDRDPKRIVHVLKDIAGCDHLDHLVTTHWHMDHFGGVAGIAQRVRI